MLSIVLWVVLNLFLQNMHGTTLAIVIPKETENRRKIIGDQEGIETSTEQIKYTSNTWTSTELSSMLIPSTERSTVNNKDNNITESVTQPNKKNTYNSTISNYIHNNESSSTIAIPTNLSLTTSSSSSKYFVQTFKPVRVNITIVKKLPKHIIDVKPNCSPGHVFVREFNICMEEY